MATRRTGFDKRERDRAKKARAAAKREKRQDRTADESGGDDETTTTPAGDQGAVLAQLAKLHQDFDDGVVDFDTFEERKAELMTQLQVE
ncbi:MAG: hypothetical protein MUF83_01340 [Acidimicrobiales bacterium]|jgi:hypothetical protein|nr:hypothetical protein [Acidimicrobiales bacterium]